MLMKIFLILIKSSDIDNDVKNISDEISEHSDEEKTTNKQENL